MGRAPREFYKGGFWHIVNRAVSNEVIFRDKSDYVFCLYKMKERLQKYTNTIHVYNLVPNHIHYLMEQTSSEIPPSKFLTIFHKDLSAYINKKYSRTGHLFQDRCKVKAITDNDYLLNVSFYINLNKILEKLQHFNRSIVISQETVEELLKEAENDPWSSFAVYLGLRDDHIVQPNFILSLLSDDIVKAKQEYRRLAKDFITSGHFLKTRDLIFEGEK